MNSCAMTANHFHRIATAAAARVACTHSIKSQSPSIIASLPSCIALRRTYATSASAMDDLRQIEKIRRRERRRQDDVPLELAFSVFKAYTLGQDIPVTAHVQLPVPEPGAKPVRGEVTLPFQTSSKKKERVLVFAVGEQAEEARKLGADIVGGDDLIQQVLEDKVTFDRCLSTKSMFPKVIKIARKLGPKGLMPSPAKGTVSDDISTMMKSMQTSTKFESSENGLVTMVVGKSAWNDDQITANIKALVAAIVLSKPPKQDASRFIESVTISGPHTPGMKMPNKYFVPKPKRPLNEVQALLASYGLI